MGCQVYFRGSLLTPQIFSISAALCSINLTSLFLAKSKYKVKVSFSLPPTYISLSLSSVCAVRKHVRNLNTLNEFYSTPCYKAQCLWQDFQ